MRKFIDINYLSEELEWSNTNINGEELFTTKELNHLIGRASERIYSILTIARFDNLKSLSEESQSAIKLMTGLQVINYTMNGSNYLDIAKKISLGGIQVDNQVNSAYPDIPAEIFDIGAKESLIEETIFYDETESTRDPIFSSQFSSQEFVYQVAILKTALEEEELANDEEFVIELLSKAKLLELINDISAGALTFETGEILSEVAIEGTDARATSDTTIYNKTKIDELISLIETTLEGKINIGDSPTNEQWNTKNNSQDIQIRTAVQMINALKLVVAELEKIIEEGGLSREIFATAAAATISNTPTKLNGTIKIVSNNPNILTYEVVPGTTPYLKFIVKKNGSFRLNLLGSLTKGNTNTTTIEGKLLDEVSGDALDTSSKTYDFTSTTNFDQQSIPLDFKVSDIDGETITQREFRVELKTLQTTTTIIAQANAIITAEMLSSVGSGSIATSDDFINTSAVPGAKGTDALNWLLDEVDFLDLNKADLDYVDTSLGNKLDKDFINDTWNTKTSIENEGNGEINITAERVDIENLEDTDIQKIWLKVERQSTTGNNLIFRLLNQNKLGDFSNYFPNDPASPTTKSYVDILFSNVSGKSMKGEK